MSASTAKAARRNTAAANGKTPAAAKRAARTKPGVKELEASLQQDQQSVEHPGVVILRVPIPDQPGNFQLQIAAINGLDPFAVPTTLEHALKINRRELGLDNEGS